MDHPRQKQSPASPDQTKSKAKDAGKKDRPGDCSPSGETIEGEASPGLTISGGGGHA